MKLSADIITKFSDYLFQEEKSESTRKKYLRDVRSFMLFADEKELSKDLLIAWKGSLIESGYAVRSINSMLASVNSLLDFLELPGYRVKNLRMQRKTYCAMDEELTKEEYLRLIKAAEKDEQLYLVIQTICSTGIRVSELQYFTVESVTRGEITVECKNKTRTILIPDKLAEMLLRYARKNCVYTGIIFKEKNGAPLDRCTVWRKMKLLSKVAEVKPEKVYPHNLRKLFARTFYRNEKDIAKLADILGHSSINTTRIYILATGTEHRKKINGLGLIV